jgi:hypothetical protein
MLGDGQSLGGQGNQSSSVHKAGDCERDHIVQGRAASLLFAHICKSGLNSLRWFVEVGRYVTKNAVCRAAADTVLAR